MESATVGVAPPSGARGTRLSAKRHAWREIQISDSTTARRVFKNIHLFEYLEMNNYAYNNLNSVLFLKKKIIIKKIN